MQMEWIIGNSLNDGIHHKVGAKNAHASRVLRLVRMVRLFRMVKLYKYIEMKMQKDKDMSTVDLFNEDEEYLPGSKSNVGAAMADLTNRRYCCQCFVMKTELFQTISCFFHILSECLQSRDFGVVDAHCDPHADGIR